MLGGEDMIEHRQFVEIGKASLRITTMQILREFQHIVRVTALRTVDVVDKVLTGLLAGEMLTTAVTTES